MPEPRVPSALLAEALDALDPTVRAALESAVVNIEVNRSALTEPAVRDELAADIAGIEVLLEGIRK